MTRLKPEQKPTGREPALIEPGLEAQLLPRADDPHIAAVEPVITLAGMANKRVLRLVQWFSGNFPSVEWLEARLDRWSEFFGLESRVMQYWISAIHVLLFGVPGVAIIVASLYVQDWDRALGHPLGAWSGYARLGVMFLGCYLLFLAWPRYIRRGQSVEQTDAEARPADTAREDFRRKFRR